MRRVSLLTTAVLCSACSSLPSKEDLTAFGDASSKGVATVSQVVASGETLRSRQEELRQASRYMRGARFAAESIPKPSDPSQAIIDAQLKIRLNALSDLQAYAKAVATAADQGAIDGLVAATEKLGSNIGELAILAAPEIAPVATPAFKAAGKAVGFGLADGYVRKVNAVVSEADPIVAEVMRLLRQDLAGLPPDIDIEAGAYAALRDEQLHIIRNDSRVTRSNLYGAYFSARTDIAANYELVKAATAIDGVLKSIADTHHALAQGQPDADLTIKRMSALSTDLAAVVAALKKG